MEDKIANVLIAVESPDWSIKIAGEPPVQTQREVCEQEVRNTHVELRILLFCVFKLSLFDKEFQVDDLEDFKQDLKCDMADTAVKAS
jgi:hypothetical protein